MSFEILKITNNNRNTGKTHTRNGIIFHVKISTETEEDKYVEFTIEKILKQSVSLRCPKSSKKCPARISAKHCLDTVEIGQSGKNKLYDFHENVTSDLLKSTCNWSLYHNVGSKCRVTGGFCQHVTHTPDCTYDFSRDVLRRVTTDAVQIKLTGSSPSFTEIKKTLKNNHFPSKTLDGKERPALEPKDFSDHAWTNVGNNFAIFASNGIRNFTNNTSEGINRAFKEEFKSAPNTLENVLLRVKEFKKNYILQKSDKMGEDRMRARPKNQIRRAERRENLVRTFHNLQPDQKLNQLLDSLKAIGFA